MQSFKDFKTLGKKLQSGKKTVKPIMLNNLTTRDQLGLNKSKLKSMDRDSLSHEKSLQLFKTTAFGNSLAASPNNTTHSPSIATKQTPGFQQLQGLTTKNKLS